MELVSWFTIVGAAGQCAFGARMLLQWLLSEKAGQVINPAMFWWLSLLGAVCMSVYGFLRNDAAIFALSSACLLCVCLQSTSERTAQAFKESYGDPYEMTGITYHNHSTCLCA